MPLVFQAEAYDNTSVLVWQRTEQMSFFVEGSDTLASYQEILDGPQEQRSMNGLVLRYLLQRLLGPNHPFIYQKDEFGKPFLQNDSRYISVSHSKNVVAVVLSDVPVGIDVQFFTPKMDKVAPKFVNEAELAYLEDHDRTTYHHVLWGAKESMYKADGKRGLDFRQNLHILPFSYDRQASCVGKIVKINSTRTFSIHYKQLLLDENFMLVYSIEN